MNKFINSFGCILFFMTIIFLVYACISNSRTTQEQPSGKHQSSVYDENQYDQAYDAGAQEEDVPEYEQGPDEMVSEVVKAWEFFFDDDNAPPRDWRRNNFEQYAYYLVQAVLMYEEIETDIGGKLPKNRNTHIVAAQIVTRESALRPRVVGVRGEVGLMQVMPRGPTIAGHRPATVRKTPELGIRLGVRWLAFSVGRCSRDLEDWSDDDWLGPLSFYSAGGKVRRRNGTCKVLDIGRRRLKKALSYRKRIDTI